MLCIHVKQEALREIMCHFDRGALNFIDHNKFRNFHEINWLCSKYAVKVLPWLNRTLSACY